MDFCKTYTKIKKYHQNYDYNLVHREDKKMQRVHAHSRCANILVVEISIFEENK